MKHILVIVALSLLLLQGSVLGFNGLRKGFVFGGGLGVAPMAKWSYDPNSVPDYIVINTPKGENVTDESNAGIGGHFLIGYAWDEQNMVVLEANGCYYSSDAFDMSDLLPGYSGQSLQLSSCYAWYHYFGPPGGSLFSMIGLGAYGWTVKGFDTNDPSVGYIVGAGYEFARHLQAGIYLSGGQTKETVYSPLRYGLTKDVNFGHMHINVLVTAIAY